jgi:hypothetical protein
MPTYLLRGFRWPRPLIRIHIILQNLDDAAAEWLVAPGTTETMLENFEETYPDVMKHLPNLRFVEQYDPEDMSSLSQPYAYVADIVEEVKLGVDVDEAKSKGVGDEQLKAITGLRNKLAPDAHIGWYVVVCGDEERWAPGMLEEEEEEGITEVEEEESVQVEEGKTVERNEAESEMAGTEQNGAAVTQSEAASTSPATSTPPVVNASEEV